MVLFSRNFANAKFLDNITLRKGEIILSFTDIGNQAQVMNF